MMNALEETSHLGNVLLDVEVELGRQTLTVREILALQPGSVVKLARSAGDNIDLMIGGSFIGSGEIVIIEETFGVRITDFIPED